MIIPFFYSWGHHKKKSVQSRNADSLCVIENDDIYLVISCLPHCSYCAVLGVKSSDSSSLLSTLAIEGEIS